MDRIQAEWRRERPELPVGSIGVITRIWRLAKILEDDRRRTMSRLGIDPATRDLLATLRRAGSPYRLTPSELAARCLVSAGAISQRVARAEGAGLVRRDRHGPDGRTVHVELTAAGHWLITGSVADLLAHEDGLLSALSDTQQAQLADLLRVLLRDLTTRFGLDDRP